MEKKENYFMTILCSGHKIVTSILYVQKKQLFSIILILTVAKIRNSFCSFEKSSYVKTIQHLSLKRKFIKRFSWRVICRFLFFCTKKKAAENILSFTKVECRGKSFTNVISHKKSFQSLLYLYEKVMISNDAMRMKVRFTILVFKS